MKKFPSIFEKDFGTELSVVYIGRPEVHEPFFNAANIEAMLGAKSPFASATNRVNTILSRIRQYLELNPNASHLNEGTEVTLIGSVKPAVMVGDDGVYKVLGVKSSHNVTARTSYYYNAATVFYVLNTAMTARANEIQHWINGEVLPSIAKYGEYIGVRKGGIDLRRCLTDSVKRQIDAKKLDEKAYGTVTDAVYRIRYGLNTYSMRNVMNIDPSDNVREFLPKDELHILGEIEAKVACLVDLGVPIEDIANNPILIKIYRKPF